MMLEFYDKLVNNDGIQVLIIFIILDVIFGILRAIKEHKLNSTIGIEGIIRKVGMIITIIVCLLVDYIININLIGFIPSDVSNVLDLPNIGLCVIFNILYIVFEILSIFKNMYKCKLPLPKKLKLYLEKLLKDFTSEVKDD